MYLYSKVYIFIQYIYTVTHIYTPYIYILYTLHYNYGHYAYILFYTLTPIYLYYTLHYPIHVGLRCLRTNTRKPANASGSPSNTHL